MVAITPKLLSLSIGNPKHREVKQLVCHVLSLLHQCHLWVSVAQSLWKEAYRWPPQRHPPETPGPHASPALDPELWVSTEEDDFMVFTTWRLPSWDHHSSHLGGRPTVLDLGITEVDVLGETPGASRAASECLSLRQQWETLSYCVVCEETNRWKTLGNTTS